MNKNTLWERCKISTNKESDQFVGIRVKENDISITFPLGYDDSIELEDNLLRKDIISLINILQKVEKKGVIDKGIKLIDKDCINFPILSYQHIILDFYKSGYVTEREIFYNTGSKGKINWKHTIQKKRPFYSNKDVVYLDFIVKKNILNHDAILTKIHEFCVYESFVKLGWLYTDMLPPKPRIQFNKKMFLSVLNESKSKTFDDKKSILIKAMIDVVNCTTYNSSVKEDFIYGTSNFEIVWEKMIDKVFGDIEKEQYYPKATWTLADKSTFPSSFLRPDTIIKSDRKIIIIDAKYYKFGMTKYKKHLPPTSSIHKQITYGEYLKSDLFKANNKNNENITVYNVFLLPFNKSENKDSEYKFFGTATSDWKNNTATFETVYGVFLDMKHLISLNYTKNCNEIDKLTSLIDNVQRTV